MAKTKRAFQSVNAEMHYNAEEFYDRMALDTYEHHIEREAGAGHYKKSPGQSAGTASPARFVAASRFFCRIRGAKNAEAAFQLH